MNRAIAMLKLRDVIRRKHLSLKTEESYCGWLLRYTGYIAKLSGQFSSEQKMEMFLSALAKQGVAASTQNQAFNAILFFYKEVLKQAIKGVNSLRAKRPQTVRVAPSVSDVRTLLANVQDTHGYPTRLVVRMLYGCGLRVCEPLDLRIKDIVWAESKLVIRGAKGGKDRMVSLPCSLVQDLKQQVRAARLIWEKDFAARIPVTLPGLLAKKYPQAQFAWQWAWVFPSNITCRHPRTGEIVRYRMHEANVQRAVKTVARAQGMMITPHYLRHAFATHAMRQGANVRDVQDALGHAQLNTTMIYLSADQRGVNSPLDVMEAVV